MTASWIQVVDRESDPALTARLDRGEAAAIPLALELGAVLLVDDGAARQVATEFGLSVIGSLGVLLAAKRSGHIDELAPVLDRMVALGMFVSPTLRARVLMLAGEDEGMGTGRRRGRSVCCERPRQPAMSALRDAVVKYSFMGRPGTSRKSQCA
jgi:hypothetical protein